MIAIPPSMLFRTVRFDLSFPLRTLATSAVNAIPRILSRPCETLATPINSASLSLRGSSSLDLRSHVATPLRIAVIPGDGTGPEVTAEALKVLAAVSKIDKFTYETQHFDWGGERYLK